MNSARNQSEFIAPGIADEHIAFSPDGKRACIIHGGSQASIIDVESRTVLSTFDLTWSETDTDGKRQSSSSSACVPEFFGDGSRVIFSGL